MPTVGGGTKRIYQHHALAVALSNFYLAVEMVAKVVNGLLI